MQYDKTFTQIQITHVEDNKDNHKFKRILVCICFLLLLFITFKNATAETIEGNTIYENSTHAYLSATPHTFHSADEYIYPSLMTKSFNGSLTVVFGYPNQ